MTTTSDEITTPEADLDAAVVHLAARARTWARLPVREKIAHLDRIHTRIGEQAAEWVRSAAAAKGLAPRTALVGEEWLSGPYAALTWVEAVRETLLALVSGKDPLDGFRVTDGPESRTVVRVFPHTVADHLLLNGFSADVWLPPEVDRQNLREEVGAFYRTPEPPGGVALVLGAGNVSSIPLLDALYKLFADGEVVLLKLNPVNDYLAGPFTAVLDGLIDDGFLRIVHGGGDVGAYLCARQELTAIHVTGSERTHNTIVYGPGEDGERRRRSDDRVIDTPVTAELGGVGPVIVVPGPWTAADFRYQAEHIVTQKLHNDGFNCIAAQVVVLPENWFGSAALQRELTTAFEAAPPRPPYYPGASERRAAFLAEFPTATTLGSDRALITDLKADDRDNYAFTEEFFTPVLATTSLPGTGAAAFLAAAVDFANNTLRGTLGANIIIHPRTVRELGPAFEQAIADLRYGTVAVNVWTGFGFATARATWGAYPGHTTDDVQSGIGVVHNALLFDRPEKTVVRGPFRPFPRSATQLTMSPRPPWFVGNRTADVTTRRLTEWAADGKLSRFPGILLSGLRG
ncbi:aldehyde dehydrogenase family protein [Nakamurella silvestris]|nr:aldehyde dehydrogenase family protein [Nakamurella silvestris]